MTFIQEATVAQRDDQLKAVNNELERVTMDLETVR